MDPLVDVSSPTIDRVVSCSVAVDPKIDRDVLWVDFVSVSTMDRVVSCAVPTMDRVVSCAVPTMDRVVSCAVPTMGRVVSCAVPTMDRVVSCAVPTMGRVVSCAVPTMDRVVSCCVSGGGADSVLPTRDTVAVVAGLPAIDTVVLACLLSSLWELSECPYK